MTARQKVLVFVALAVVGGVAGALFAVRHRPDPGQTVRSWLADYDSIQRSLAGLRDRSFLDAEVAAARAELVGAIGAHVRANRPGADSLLERADTLEKQLESIRSGAAIDPQRYAELLQEYQSIYAELEPAEREALLDPTVQAQFEAFRVLLDVKMYRLATPRERGALDRLREIEARVEALPPEVVDSLMAPLEITR